MASKSFKSLIFVAGLCLITWLGCTFTVLAADVFWDSAVNGDWDDPTKWTGGVLPGAGDDVFIDVDGTYTVTIDAANVSVNSLTVGGASGTQTLAVEFRTVTLAADSELGVNGCLQIRSGTINGPGELDLKGRTRILNTSTFDNPVTNVAGGRVVIEGSTVGDAELRVDEDFVNNGEVCLTNSDPGTERTARLTVRDGVLFENATGGSVTVKPGTNSGQRRLTINNNGTLRNFGGIHIATSSILSPGSNSDFDNRGILNITGGNLTVSQVGTSDFILVSTVTVGLGQVLEIIGGRLESAGGTLNGFGELRLQSGTITGNTTFEPKLDSRLRGCTINAPVKNTEQIALINTNIFTNTIENATGAIILIVGGLNGDSELRLENVCDNFGEVRLTNDHPSLGRSSTLRLNNASARLTNESVGTVTIESGTFGGFRQMAINANAEFENLGTTDINTDATFFNNALGDIDQAGTLNVSGGDLLLHNSGSSEFFNSGTVNVEAGRTARWNSGIFSPQGGSVEGDGFSQFHFVAIAPSGTFANEMDAEFRAVTVSSDFVNNDRADFQNTSTFNGSFTNGPGATTRIEAGDNGDADMRFAGPGINRGLLELTNSDPLNARAARLRIQPNQEFINATGATVATLPGTTLGDRFLIPEQNSLFDNFGNVVVGVETDIDINGGTFRNHALVTVTHASLTVDMDANGTFKNAGAVNTADPFFFQLDNGTYESCGGEIIGDGLMDVLFTKFEGDDIESKVDAQMRGATFEVAYSNRNEMELTGTNTFNKELLNTSTATLFVNATQLGGDGLLRINAEMQNDGMLQLGNNHPGQARTSTIQLGDGGELTLGTNGTITFDPGVSGGKRVLNLLANSKARNYGQINVNVESEIKISNAEFDNALILNVSQADIRVNMSGAQAVMRNRGTIDVKAGRRFETSSGQFQDQGGVFSGDGTFYTEFGDLFSSSTFISAISTQMRSTNVKSPFENQDDLLLEGSVRFEDQLVNRINSAITVSGSNAGDGQLITVKKFVNEGDVELRNDNQFSDRNAILRIDSLLCNATGATIKTERGSQGGRRELSISAGASLINHGLVTTCTTSLIRNNGGILNSDGVIDIGDEVLENQQNFFSETRLGGEVVIGPNGQFLIDDGSLFLKDPFMSGPGNLELVFVEVDSDGPIVNKELITARNTEFKKQVINEKLMKLRGEVKLAMGFINENSGALLLQAVAIGQKAIVSLEAELKNLGTITMDNFDAAGNNTTRLIVENGASVTSGPGAALNVKQTEAGTATVEFKGSSPKPFDPGNISLADEAYLLFEKAPLNIRELLLSGNGSVEFDGTNPGRLQALAPGNSPGLINLIGDVVLGSTATYTVELGGTSAVIEHDQITSSGGNLTFDGVLDIDLINGFTPSAGDEFTVFTYESFSGAFSEVRDAGLGGGLFLVPDYRADKLVLFVSDETTVDVNVYMMGLWDGLTHKRSAAIVELREGADLATSTLRARKSALFSSTATLRVNFDNVQSDDYWVIVRHGGNMSIASATRLAVTQGEVNTIDLTATANVVNGTNGMLTVLLNGVNYDVVRTGDFNADLSVSADDFIQLFIPNFGVVNPGQVPLLD